MNSRASKILSAANWRHALAEIAFIVVGVLIALGANSWWQGREDRARERVILEQLAAATAENVNRINSAIEQDSFYRTHATKLLGVMRGSAKPGSPDSIGIWFVFAGSSSDFHPLTGVYTALLSTGELNLLRNDPLRSRIPAIAGEMEGAIEQLRIYDAEAVALITEFGRLLNLVDVMVSLSLQQSPWYRMPPSMSFRSLTARDIDALRQNPETQRVLVRSWINLGNRLGLLYTLRDEVTKLQTDLENELAR